MLAIAAGMVASPAAAVVSPGSAAARARPAATTPAASTPAPTTPALGVTGATLAPIAASSTADDDAGGGTPGGEGDWLAANGLSSPACAHSRTPACKASGTVTIPVAPGHYSFDTWTEGGTLGTPTWNGIVSGILGFAWALIVQITVAVFSVLEWAMSVNLTQMGGGALSRVHLINASWGMPIAAVMLALGAIWVATQTFSERKIGAALSGVASGFLTMGVSLAILTNPAGTIGQLTAMTAELGRAAASAPLAIAAPNTSLDDGMKQTWQVVIERPFALLEFGDTDWGTDPAQRDPKLVAAARDIAREQGPDVLARVNAAKTNAGVFAVWGSNSNERNSRRKDKCEGGPCLLNVLCGGEEDLDDCKGSMAKYVKARTDEGVTNRVAQVPMIGLGMLSIWIIFGAIAVGLLWSFLSIFKNLIVLAYLWVLALTFKAELRRKPVEIVLNLVGSAVALILFGILAGVAITIFLIVQSLGLPWALQWVLSIIALVGLFLERGEITDVMKRLLTQPQKTTGGIGGFAGRLASSYATGVGLGALRGRRPAGASIGAGTGTGGGIPTSLPVDPAAAQAAAGAQERPGMVKTAAAGALGGAVLGPIGSAAAVGALHRRQVAAGAKQAAGALSDASGRITGPLASAASAWNASSLDGIPTDGEQVAAVLAAQQAARVERGAAAAGQLPAAEQAAMEHLRAYGDAVSEHVGAGVDDPRRASLQQVAEEAGRAHEQAEAHVETLKSAIDSGHAAQAWDPADSTGPQAQRAAAWLDTQAQTPVSQRPYRQLAGIHGVSPAQWDSLGDERQGELRGAINDALAARTPGPGGDRPSALQALGTVASQQPWWQQ